MKNTIWGIVLGILVGAAAMWAVLRYASPHSQESEQQPEAPKESRVQHGTNGEVFVRLSKQSQALAGIKTEGLQTLEVPPEIKAYGQVLDPAPLATLMIEGASNRAALEASTREYQRLKILYNQGQNISTRALETSEAALKRDQILATAVQTRLVLALGRTIAERPDLQAFIDKLVGLKSALVRIDLPLGQALQTPPTGARLAVAVSEETPLPADYLGPAASADPQTQGQGFLFLIESNAPPAGAAMAAWLQIPGKSQQGFVVPRAALLRHHGSHFVYSQAGEELFERKQVELERPLQNGWLVQGKLAQREKVVVQGAQLLLSEEFKAQGEGEE